MQKFREIIRHIVLCRIAHRFVPDIRAASSVAVFRRLQKASLSERMQKIGVGIQIGIRPAVRQRLFQRPARIGISVPARGVAALVGVAQFAVGRIARVKAV